MAILRHVILFCLFLVPGISFAETIPATSVPANTDVGAAIQGHMGPGPSGAVVYSTFGQACDAVRTYPYGVLPKGNCTDSPSGSPWNNGGTSGTCYYNTSGTNCSGMTSATPTMAWKCPTGSTVNNGRCVSNAQSYSCPSTGGWTLSGSQCTRADCVAPATRQPDGSCLNPCLAKSQQAPTYAWFKSAIGAPTPDGQTYCDGGCTAAVNPAPTGTSYNNGKFKLQRYEIVNLPTECTGGNALPTADAGAVNPPEPPKKPVCAANEGVLTTTSGTIACVPPGVPTQEVPVVRKDSRTETFPDGSTRKTDTTYTKDPASQVQDTQQTITNTPATGGGVGMAGTPGTSSSGSSTQPSSGTDPDASDFCQKNGQLQICKGDMNKEETQIQVRDYIKSLTDPGSTAYSAIETAKQSTQSDSDLQIEIDKFTAAASGTFSPDESSKSSWGSAMSSGWFEPITRQGCSPYFAQIGGRTWTLDICPTAEKISVISEYVLWFLLVVGTFVMFTGGAMSKGS